MKNYLSITNTAAVVGLAFALSACSSQEEMVAKPAPVAPRCGSKSLKRKRHRRKQLKLPATSDYWILKRIT